MDAAREIPEFVDRPAEAVRNSPDHRAHILQLIGNLCLRPVKRHREGGELLSRSVVQAALDPPSTLVGRGDRASA